MVFVETTHLRNAGLPDLWSMSVYRFSLKSVEIASASVLSRLTLPLRKGVALSSISTEEVFDAVGNLAAMLQGDLFVRPLNHDAAQILGA